MEHKAAIVVALLSLLAASSAQDVCSLPAEVGPCRGMVRAFYFNSRSGQCERFTYGGCQGNGNRFTSLEDCQARCSHN